MGGWIGFPWLRNRIPNYAHKGQKRVEGCVGIFPPSARIRVSWGSRDL